MQEVIQSPPRTLMEVFRMLPEGTRAELINGILYMSPAPSLDHQDVVVSLTTELNQFLKKKKAGKLYVSPVDVYLNSTNAYQPDLVIILNKNLSILKSNGVYGAPDIVFEILSPGTKKFDLVKKKNVYESSGVLEYWIVDPLLAKVTIFTLMEGWYEPTEFQGVDLIKSLTFPDLHPSVEQILRQQI